MCFFVVGFFWIVSTFGGGLLRDKSNAAIAVMVTIAMIIMYVLLRLDIGCGLFGVVSEEPVAGVVAVGAFPSIKGDSASTNRA